MDIRSFLITLIVSLSVGMFIGFTLRDFSQFVIEFIRKYLIKPRFLKPYQTNKNTESLNEETKAES
jgi:hypothetical protein